MPKVTYNPRNPDEQDKPVKMAGFTFEPGKAVDVPDDHPMARKLAGNPWFSVQGEKREVAERKKNAPLNPGERTEGLPSSIDINYPPGQGQKYDPPSVLTAAGETRPPAEGVRETEEQLKAAREKGSKKSAAKDQSSDEAAKPRRGPSPKRSSKKAR